ncbi:MAG: hypothetical protein HPY83_12180 [Anaerolineae bacterium]|nr:hypothetical protein [Anaerolineae bacterium]
MNDTSRQRMAYLIGAVIVWVAIIIATAAVLAESPQLSTMLAILGGGAVWFVVIVPGAIWRPR